VELSPNNFCRAKAMNITHYECVPVFLLLYLFSSLYCLARPCFSTLSHKGHNFCKKLLSIKCVFCFSVHLFLKHALSCYCYHRSDSERLVVRQQSISLVINIFHLLCILYLVENISLDKYIVLCAEIETMKVIPYSQPIHRRWNAITSLENIRSLEDCSYLPEKFSSFSSDPNSRYHKTGRCYLSSAR
jgi:hypothetical protein